MMNHSEPLAHISRRDFGRRVAVIAGSGAIVTPALSLSLPTAVAQEGMHKGHADGPLRNGHIEVARLPFHLKPVFDQAFSCNNIVAKVEEATIGGQKLRAIEQRPDVFGWGLITFFLRFDPALIGKDMTFLSEVGWNGKAEGEAVFSVEINGDIVIDGAVGDKDQAAKLERKLPVKAREMRLTLMLDSIRGNNDFSFWWGDPQLTA